MNDEAKLQDNQFILNNITLETSDLDQMLSKSENLDLMISNLAIRKSQIGDIITQAKTLGYKTPEERRTFVGNTNPAPVAGV